MKLTVRESIFLAFWALFFLLMSIDYEGRLLLFLVASFTLSLFYFYLGFKLINSSSYVSLMVSIAFAISIPAAIMAIPFTIWDWDGDWILMLVLLNGVFMIYILVLLVRERELRIISILKTLLLRSFIFFAISGYFSLGIVEYPFYRDSLIFFSAGNENTINYLRMHGNYQQAKKLFKNGKCGEALEYSLASFNEGLTWIGKLEDESDSISRLKLNRIQGITNYTYEIYNCLATDLKKSGKYKEELEFRFLAESFITMTDQRELGWKKEEANSIQSIAICYENLSMPELASRYYLLTLDYWMGEVKLEDRYLATFLSNYSKFLQQQSEFEASTEGFNESVRILLKDSLNSKHWEGLSTAYLGLTYTNLVYDDWAEADYNLRKANSFMGSTCRYLYFKGALFSELSNVDSSNYYLKKAITCYQQSERSHHIPSAYGKMFTNAMQEANYDSAYLFLKKAMSITLEKYNVDSYRYHYFVLKEASYNYTIGNYKLAKEQYLRALEAYKKELGDHHLSIAKIYTGLAMTNIELSNKVDAFNNIEFAIKIAEAKGYSKFKGNSDLINNIAYVKYVKGDFQVSSFLYSEVLDLNEESGITASNSINGLGLIATGVNEFLKADSLFNQSINIKTKLLGRDHPSTAIVIMNKALLAMDEMKFDYAEKLLLETLDSYQEYHREYHPDIGVILYHLGEINLRKSNKDESLVCFNKALEIMQSNFDEGHERVQRIKKKLISLGDSI